MKRITVIFGTRPEAIKMCPLVNELKGRSGFNVSVCVSGQHRDMLDGVLREFFVEPDMDMNIMREGQTLFDLTRAVLEGAEKAIRSQAPDAVLVHGDTTTAFASALAAFYLNVPVLHVEAGLRSGDVHAPFPEEMNRRAIALTAKYHFAPTESARQNLLKEGISDENIFVVGNTVADALKLTVRKEFRHPILDFARDGELIFVTAHRRENIGEPIKNIAYALKRISDSFDNVRIVIPMHKNPAVRAYISEILGDCKRILLTEPLGVSDCHNIMARSRMILTDSGGIQEEAVSLGVPTLVLRSVTERQEGAELGVLKLVGSDGDAIFSSFRELFEDSEKYKKAARATALYGNGDASQRIADIIERLPI